MEAKDTDKDIIERLEEYKWLDLKLFEEFYNPLNISVESGGFTITLRGIIILRDGFYLFFDSGETKIDWRPQFRVLTDDLGNKFIGGCHLLSHYNYMFTKFFPPLNPNVHFLSLEIDEITLLTGWNCEIHHEMDRIKAQDISEEEKNRMMAPLNSRLDNEIKNERKPDTKEEGRWKFQIDLTDLKKQEYQYKEIYSHKRKQPVVFETIITAWKRIQNDYLRSRGKENKWKFDKFQEEFITIEKIWSIPGGFLLEFSINRTLRNVFTFSEKGMFFRKGDEFARPLVIVGEHYHRYGETRINIYMNFNNGEKRQIRNVFYFIADLKDDSPEYILENLEFFDTYPEELFHRLVHSILSIRLRKAELKKYIDEGNPFVLDWEQWKDIIGDMNEVDASQYGEGSVPHAIQGPSFF